MFPSLAFLVVVAAVPAPQAPGAALPDTAKMNILLIDIEDCNAGALGCYGNPICKTPNLDRLATSGVRFDRAYAQAICCNPSRSSFLTGLRPLSTHVTTNSHVMNEHLPPGTLTLPEMLKTRGFYLADIGKLFHTVEYAERQMAVFDRIEMYAKPKGWKGPKPIRTFPPVAQAKQGPPAPKDQKSKEFRQWRARQSDRYGDSGREVEEEHDYRMAKTAAALLEEFGRSKQQFFLAVSQSRPHTPLICPKKYLDRYDPAKIPSPPAPAEKLVNFPYPRRAAGGNPDIFMKQQPTAQQAREAIAAYYGCVSFVDDNIGMILDALDRAGLAQNTIVVFLGDHGFHLGDHGFWSKYSMLEATRRAPLIVRVPGAPANGNACQEIVEFVDLVPTLGQLARMELPKNLEGISFAPLLVNPQRPWKKAMFLVEDGVGNGVSQVVRTKRYSYMEFQRGPVPAALYDLERDPWETVNLVDDLAHAAARKEMATLLHAGWKAALPPAPDGKKPLSQ